MYASRCTYIETSPPSCASTTTSAPSIIRPTNTTRPRAGATTSAAHSPAMSTPSWKCPYVTPAYARQGARERNGARQRRAFIRGGACAEHKKAQKTDAEGEEGARKRVTRSQCGGHILDKSGMSAVTKVVAGRGAEGSLALRTNECEKNQC